jgi:sarcosine oxidase subunit alpha
LLSQSGGRLRFDETLGAFRPGSSRQRVRVVGGANGDQLPACDGAPLLAAADGKERRQWVDFQNDVTVADIRGAVHEGYVSVEHLKRYTTTGMAVDQGKTSNLNALAVLSRLSGTPVASIGTTTFRPPYSPITLGALAGMRRGAHFMPLRRLPAHDRHVALGAQFANYGGWLRPECYPQHGETMDEAIRREALAARNACVLFDGSPLGKIEVRGPDAARFLSRFYINNVELPPGRVRYGMMLTENGSILDDGVFACLGEHRYQICTTSAGAARIFAWLEEWQQCEWPDLDVVLLPVTTQYATLTVSGPRAREVIQAVGTDIDCSATAFPHLHVREGIVGGCAARVFRVSYTGELSYEINVPARRAPSLLDRLLSVGRDYGIVPMGVETLMLLRAEKGYLHVGADTDATTLPDDVGFGAVARKKKDDFIGRRSLTRSDALREDRLQFVGLLSENPAEVLAVGSQILPRPGAKLPVRSQGRVTSSAMSPTLGRSIALALIERGRSRIGGIVEVYDQGVRRLARITEPAFYDPAGARLNA